MVAGIDGETPATAAAVRTSPCRHCGRGDAAPCRPRCSLSLLPSPPGALARQQRAPAATRPRRARAMPCTPCAARARSRQGQEPERSRARHASPPCPLGPPNTPQRSRTLHRPTASSHDRGCPLHRVHHAPPGRYKWHPVPLFSPHRPTASPPLTSSPSRALPGGRSSCREAPAARGLLELTAPR